MLNHMFFGCQFFAYFWPTRAKLSKTKKRGQNMGMKYHPNLLEDIYDPDCTGVDSQTDRIC
jgi:hypothetical protein